MKIFTKALNKALGKNKHSLEVTTEVNKILNLDTWKSIILTSFLSIS